MARGSRSRSNREADFDSRTGQAAPQRARIPRESKGLFGQSCILTSVSRSRILAFVISGIMLAMLCVLLYKAFDIHDPQPFGVDPELPLFMLGSMLLLCIGTLVLIARLVASRLSESKVSSFWFLGIPPDVQRLSHLFEAEWLLFSPPRTIISLRI